MTPLEITQLRLHQQHLLGQQCTSPAELVAWMGAVQAQDYEMSKWAVAARVPNTTEMQMEEALNSGQILRTHVMRPTWHLVSPNDIRWMIDLTAPSVLKLIKTYYKKYELSDDILNKTNTIIEKALLEHHTLTRDEIMQILAQHGILASDVRAAHIMFHAELTCLVCNGARKGKQITYALMDKRAPLTKPLQKDEALARLAQMYFRSHSPATLKDFAWWSGLNMGDTRKAIDFIKNELISFDFNQTTYYLLPVKMPKTIEKDVFLLPAFDEYMVSYTDRTAALPPQFTKEVINNTGIFKPIIVYKGSVMGAWKRTVKPKSVDIELMPFEAISSDLRDIINAQLIDFQLYIDKPVIFKN